MAPPTSSHSNVSDQNRTQSGQANGRKSKHRGSRKRSTSSPFASLLATLASFSSSNTSSAATPSIRNPSSTSKSLTALTTTSNGPKDRPRPVTQDAHVKSMPSLRDVPAKALVRRATTPAKQALVVSTKSASKTPTPKPARPDVFSFQNGESRPPSPRPRNTSSTAKIVPKQARRSVDTDRVLSSPIPVRPVTIPSPGVSLDDSDSDSGLTASESSSPPDTPTPASRRLVALPAVSGSQDAVGRSIHPEDFHNSRRRGQRLDKIEVPPEAPTAPHVQHIQPTPPSNYMLRASSFDYLSSPSTQNPFVPNSNPALYPSAPGAYSSVLSPPGPPMSPPNPYPTPPLEQAHSGHQQRRPGYSQGPPLSQSVQALRIAPPRKSVTQNQSAQSNQPSIDIDLYPRQYAQLTQQMIRRCESIINTLEGDLAHLDATTTGRDGSPGCWHRDQLVMRLTNAIIMHHRLLDTWSKVSPLRKLTSLPQSTTTSNKLAAIENDIRHNMETYKKLHGFDMDGTIAHIVNDLVQIGDEATAIGGHGGTDRQSLAYLFGAILVLLLLEGGFGVKSVLAGALILGLWRCAM